MAEKTKLLSIKDVCITISVSRATIYRWLSANQFPSPIKLTPMTVRWREADVMAWINSKSVSI